RWLLRCWLQLLSLIGVIWRLIRTHHEPAFAGFLLPAALAFLAFSPYKVIAKQAPLALYRRMAGGVWVQLSKMRLLFKAMLYLRSWRAGMALCALGGTLL